MATVASDTKGESPRKLALVIGIGKYNYGKNLSNPENDANDMSSALEKIGFTVTKAINLTRIQIRHILADFEESIQSGDIVLFYFTGYGIQWEDQYYLIPQDNADIDSVKLNQRTIKIQRIFEDLSDRKPFVTIFLLDCCRKYHLANSKLVELQGMNKVGSLIAFACTPGTTADDREGQRNSLFTKYLLEHIITPNKSIQMILHDVTTKVMKESQEKQTPFVIDSLTHKNIYLYGPTLRAPLRSSLTDIHPNAAWTKNGLTVAGGTGQGSGLSQLFRPNGLYVDDDQIIYIADMLNHRIVTWKHGATSGHVIAGGNGRGDEAHQLNEPQDVIVDKERDSLIICDNGNRRVVRWPRQNGTYGETIISNISCTSLTMDENRFLYVVDNEKSEVKRYRIGDTEGTVVAGGNGQGNRLDQLSNPCYVFVDRDHSVYVSECDNHRVTRWRKGAKQGIVVAGGQGKGGGLTQVNYSQGVVVDQLGSVYVADYWNNRIMRWPKGAMEGSILAGGNGKGGQPNQLNTPKGLAFDRHGNLYVVDTANHRVQKFNIEQTTN